MFHRNKGFKITVHTLLVFLVIPGHGQLTMQYTNGPLANYTCRAYNTDDGLLQNEIKDILQLPNGRLVVQTNDGIVFFDGTSFTPITHDKNYSRQFFKKLVSIDQGKLIYGIDINNDFYQLFPEYKQQKIDKIKFVNVEAKGNSLILIDEHFTVYEYTPKNDDLKYVFSGSWVPPRLKTYIRKMKLLGNNIYLGTQEGLMHINLKKHSIRRLHDENCFEIKLNPTDNAVYANGGNKLYKLAGDTVTLVATLSENKNIMTFAFAGRDRYLVGGNRGLYRVFNNKQIKLSGVSVQVLECIDSDELFFAGTMSDGLLKYQVSVCSVFDENSGLDTFVSSQSMRSIVQDSEKNIIAAQECYHLKQLSENDRFINYNSIGKCFASLASINDTLYAGAYMDGIFRFKSNKLIDSLQTPQIRAGAAHAIFKSSAGQFWIGTSKGIATGRSFLGLKPYFQPIINNQINCFYETSEHAICVGGSKGVLIIKDNKPFRIYNSFLGLECKEVRSFYEDYEGKLWIGTYGGGLYCLEGDSLTSINSKPGCFLSHDVFCLALDDGGNVYMTSNNGLWRVAFRKLDRFYKGKRHYLIPYFFGKASGLKNTEFNGGFQNNYLKHDSVFYFPGVDGVIKVNTSVRTNTPLNLLIDQVIVNGGSVNDYSNIVLPPDKNSIQVTASAINYDGSRNVYYQFLLELPEDKKSQLKWSLPQKNNVLNFVQLPHGKYKLRLRAIDGSNEDNPPEVAIEFTIKPHFYQTVWFRLTVTLIAFFILEIVFIWRMRVLKQKYLTEAKNKKNLADLELKAIQAQLNPHFISNCLNNIKSYILQEDFTRANDMLNSFSLIIRAALENSDLRFISFAKEFALIKNYLTLEKMRLRDRLEYVLASDPDIDPTLLIPNQIISTYLENAFIHGIAHLENRKGVIMVSFYRLNGKYILCEIVDNGIGLAKSRLINKVQNKHISMGTKLTQNKIKYLKDFYHYDCQITITDNIDDSGLVTGTTVKLFFPILNYESSYN